MTPEEGVQGRGEREKTGISLGLFARETSTVTLPRLNQLTANLLCAISMLGLSRLGKS